MKYTNEKAQLFLIALLKKYGVKKVVVSPGTTNLTLVGSLMADDYFELYSAADERSAAYMACGMAEESHEAVMLTCTGATASRNYLPGITEAYYRKLPVLAVTASQNISRVGHMVPQVIDRRVQPNDTYIWHETISQPQTGLDEWDITLRLNRALQYLRRNGGGPVNINLVTGYSRDYSVEELPDVKRIGFYTLEDRLPGIPDGKIGILVGNHRPFSASLTEKIDAFCEKYGAIVYCDLGSNYNGRYRVSSALYGVQPVNKPHFANDLVIHIGETGAYGNDSVNARKSLWRVSPDGRYSDLKQSLTDVFEMSEEAFFSHYANAETSGSRKTEAETRLKEFCDYYDDLLSRFPEVPLSNVWLAKTTAKRFPENSAVHFGILHSVRCWAFFELPDSVRGNTFINTGGFGIDGCMSSAIGGSIIHPQQLHYLVIGDLAFFYDLNSLGNRQIGRNLRILLINNGMGTEFRNFNHPGHAFGDAADGYIAAAGHYGNKSRSLIRHYATDLGFEYMSATTKEEYLANLDRFMSPEIGEKSMVFEVFTDHKDESDAIYGAMHIEKGHSEAYFKMRKYVPDNVVNAVKKAIGRE